MEQKNNGGCLPVVMLILIAIVAFLFIANKDKTIGGGNNTDSKNTTITISNEENVPEATVCPPEKGERKFVKTTAGLKFRKDDGSREQIGYVPKGEVLEILETDPYNPNRLIALWGEKKGSVWNRYLVDWYTEEINPETTKPEVSKPTATEPTLTEPTTKPEGRKFVVTTAELNLRDPDGSGKLIQLLQPGEVLEILEQDPKDSKRVIVLWYRIKASILNSGLKELKNVPEFHGSGYIGVSYSEDLNFRVAGEDSEIIQVISKNHYFQVLGRYVGDDSRVVAIFRGDIATLWSKPITKIKGNAVYIDEKMQMATLIKNGEFVANTPCVTGTKGKSETPKGRFHIYHKEEDRYLQGKDLEGKPYKSWVEYWMPFKGGCGLHDASWRNEFGGTIYQKKGSLGCVNLPHWFAEKVYDSVKINDEVCVAN